MIRPVSRSPLTDRLLSALLLVEAYEDQHPPHPVTRAALQQALQNLIADLQELNADPAGQIPAPAAKRSFDRYARNRCPMPCELSLSFDADLHPVAGRCTVCGEAMPTPPPELTQDADRILWLSGNFIDHKRLKHLPLPESDDDAPPITDRRYNPTR